MSYSIDRSTPGSKLLARHEFDNASFPFSAAHWTFTAGVSAVVTAGELVVTVGAFTNTLAAVYNQLASRSKRFIFAVIRPSVISAGIRCGVAAHITDTTPGSVDFVSQNYPCGFASIRYFGESVNGAGTALTSTADNVPVNTDIRVGLFVNAGAAARWESRGSTLFSAALPTHTTGQSGLHLQTGSGAPKMNVRRWIECTDRFVYVSGLPTDAVVEVQNASSSVLATATAAAGLASVDMISVQIHTATKLVVKLYGDTLATYNVTGTEIIEPGETYAFTEDATPAFTAPAEGSVHGTNVTLQWDAFDFGDANPVEYDLDFTTSNVWTSLAAATSAESFLWNRDATLRGLAVTVRLRARNTVTLEETEYSYLTFSFAGALKYADVVLAAGAAEYWKLEEAAGNFASSVVGGTEATAYDYTLGGDGAIDEREYDGAVCNGIRTHTPLVPVRKFFRIQGAITERFVDNFTILQWVKPVNATAMSDPSGTAGLTGTDYFVLEALFPGSHVDPTGIGLGLQVGTNGMCVRQHSTGNLHIASSYVGAIPSTSWSLVALVVRRVGFRRWIELYLNGVYCGDLAGVYTESFIDNKELGCWPFYGQSNLNISDSAYYGSTFEGGIDEVSWYDYVLSEAQIAQHYYAAVLPGIAAVGSFTAPVADIVRGVPFLVEWDAAAGANGYLLEVWNGSSWDFLAVTSDPEYLWTPAVAKLNVKLRVIGTLNGYYEECGPGFTESAVFNIVSSDDAEPPARRAWAFVLDGHVFYVLGSYGGMTLLYDETSDQWCRWKTGSRLFWNMHRGVMWRGRVLAADIELPVIWELDPSSMLDEEAVEITRAVTGFQPVRGDASIRQGSMRIIARQQSGVAIDATLSLRFSDDGGRTWSQTYSFDLSNATERLEFRSLGRLRKPGRIWDITDTGGLIRIDGAEGVLEDG